MACSQEFEHGVFVTESSQQRKRELGPGEWLKGHFRYGCFDFGCVNLFVLFNWVGCRRVLSRPLVRCSACRACGIRKAARSATIASRDGTSADRSPAALPTCAVFSRQWRTPASARQANPPGPRSRAAQMSQQWPGSGVLHQKHNFDSISRCCTPKLPHGILTEMTQCPDLPASGSQITRQVA